MALGRDGISRSAIIRPQQPVVVIQAVTGSASVTAVASIVASSLTSASATLAASAEVIASSLAAGTASISAAADVVASSLASGAASISVSATVNTGDITVTGTANLAASASVSIMSQVVEGSASIGASAAVAVTSNVAEATASISCHATVVVGPSPTSDEGDGTGATASAEIAMPLEDYFETPSRKSVRVVGQVHGEVDAPEVRAKGVHGYVEWKTFLGGMPVKMQRQEITPVVIKPPKPIEPPPVVTSLVLPALSALQELPSSPESTKTIHIHYHLKRQPKKRVSVKVDHTEIDPDSDDDLMTIARLCLSELLP